MARMKLHREGTYNDLAVNLNNGPLRCNDLNRLHELLSYYYHTYRRTAVVHLILGTDKGYTQRGRKFCNEPIKYFTENFMAYAHSLPLAKNLDMNYVWRTEVGEEGKIHWHLFLLCNYDAMMSVSTLRLEEASRIWNRALGIHGSQDKGLIQRVPCDLKDGMHSGNAEHFNKIFHWMSYISKCDQSGMLGHLRRTFQTSQFPRVQVG